MIPGLHAGIAARSHFLINGRPRIRLTFRTHLTLRLPAMSREILDYRSTPASAGLETRPRAASTATAGAPRRSSATSGNGWPALRASEQSLAAGG